MTKNVRNPESFSGERMRLACRRWRLANDFFLLLEEDFGAAFRLNRFESELQIVD